MTVNGVAYELPTWEPHTDGSGSSSSLPEETLLLTPVAAEGTKPSNTMGVARRLSTGQVFLTNQIVSLCGLDPSEQLLPTPTTSEATGAGNGPNKTGGDNLRTVVTLLPTPCASVANDGEGTETWLARRERVKETAANGNGMGMPLTIAVQLLPTPRAQNGEDRNQTIWARPADQPQNLENALAVTLPTGDHTPQLFVDGKPCEEPPLPLPN